MFSQATITSGPIATRSGADILISWTSSAALTATYQVYLDRRLTWSGMATECWIQVPPDGGMHEVVVGTCLLAESQIDLSASIPAPPGTGSVATLTWLGGTFQSDRLAEFRVYKGLSPGVNALTTSTPQAIIPAYPQSVILDGFGLGGFGLGGFGQSTSTYSYSTSPLPSGEWRFLIVPFNDTGDAGAASAINVTIVGRPTPPLANQNGSRVSYTYNPTTRQATLSWTPG